MRSRPTTDRHFFEDVADHAGAAYLRYSFTKGTEQEVAFLVDELGLGPATRVLDVGCGPGRHLIALGGHGVGVVGLDISERFLSIARSSGARACVRGDGRSLPFPEASFDVVVSLCQGGFGLVRGEDATVLMEMARVVRPGGTVCVSAFSSYFAVRYLEETDTFDADVGVNHERAMVKNEVGAEREFDLWTTCFTPRELRLMATLAGLRVRHLWSVTPGAYAPNPPDLDHAEFLLVAERPA